MAEADCPSCDAMGYRSCDECGGPVMQHEVRGPAGEELCAYCLIDAGIELPEPAWMKNLPPQKKLRL
jgi:hypothetical protein